MGKAVDCNHETNYYIEVDAPIVFRSDGTVKHVTYRCCKCGRQIYKDHFWDNTWKEA